MNAFRAKLADARIEAEPEMVFNANMSNIIAYSQNASLVFLPFRLKGDQPLDPFDNPIEQILSDLPTTALVLAAEDIVLESEPDTGKAGEVAKALDARVDAEKKMRQTQKAAEAAKEKVTRLKEELARLDSETDKNKINPSTREESGVLPKRKPKQQQPLKRLKISESSRQNQTKKLKMHSIQKINKFNYFGPTANRKGANKFVWIFRQT
jgi:hypothetical protein